VIVTCAEHSRAAGEPLAGTATRARRWLLVEHGGVWGRDAILDTRLPRAVRDRMLEWQGDDPLARVLLIRRPDRRRVAAATVFVARAGEEESSLSRVELESIDGLPAADLDAGTPLAGPLYLVCTHGRRDPCCARMGVPVYEALGAEAGVESVWQSSHLGGHRFAGNVLVLPDGLQLGRVRAGDVAGVTAFVRADAIPLGFYRGRTIYEPAVQAAERALRERLGIASLADVVYVGSTADGRHAFRTPGGEMGARVTERQGPSIRPSCGEEEEPSRCFDVDAFVALTTGS
jgi:hypothetical protein